MIDPDDFPKVQTAHWKKLPYWIFTPVGLILCGGVALVWYHPDGSPAWAIWANLICQVLAIVLTAVLLGSVASQVVQGPAWLPDSIPHQDNWDALDTDAAHQYSRVHPTLRGHCRSSRDHAISLRGPRPRLARLCRRQNSRGTEAISG